ncbi:MAG: hypothetical protein HGA80_08555 [Candidatus Omnitrophica bacterium]|nr:hypothetical protein [Candidatus Omnitrophota bacterium]
MLSDKIIKPILAITVLVAGLWVGSSIAMHKRLWLDEIYSQTSSIEPLSWQQIWSGRIPEGNNSPLFYSIQKVLCQAFHYQGVDLWQQDDQPGRLILRIDPIIFMSVALALLTWYFLALEGWAGGALAVVLFITSHMVWGYWAEARPYAMVVMGTVWQGLALHRFLKDRTETGRTGMICACHLFLALTSALSVIQVAAASLVLWLGGMRRVRDIIFCCILPLTIGFSYYSLAIHHRSWFAPHEGPIPLILANITSGRLVALLVFPVVILCLERFLRKPVERRVWLFALWTGLTLAGYILLLTYMKINSNPQAMGSAQVSSRYFITLTPVGIMGMLILSMALLRQVREHWLKWPVWIALLAIVLPRLIKTYHWVVAMHVWGG